mmetsp:Transcript_51147/g.108868  ORF Transcript_51147/g.108868 Transcript_51147/m.108868 type:complete len:220 (-) Transcript_51147:2367-3026(-)
MGPDEVLIVHGVELGYCGILHPHGSHYRHPGDASLPEHRVPVREQRVPRHGRPPQPHHSLVPKHPRLPPFGVVVGVPSEEWLVRPRLHPPRHELSVAVSEESAHVGPHEGKCANVQAEEHGRGDLKVGPLGLVVPCPYGAVPLAGGKEGTGQHEGADVVPLVPLYKSLPSRAVEEHSVEVVPLPVLAPVQVQEILLHGDLRPIEDARLIHIIPREQFRG